LASYDQNSSDVFKSKNARVSATAAASQSKHPLNKRHGHESCSGLVIHETDFNNDTARLKPPEPVVTRTKRLLAPATHGTRTTASPVLASNLLEHSLVESYENEIYNKAISMFNVAPPVTATTASTSVTTSATKPSVDSKRTHFQFTLSTQKTSNNSKTMGKSSTSTSTTSSSHRSDQNNMVGRGTRGFFCSLRAIDSKKQKSCEILESAAASRRSCNIKYKSTAGTSSSRRNDITNNHLVFQFKKGRVVLPGGHHDNEESTVSLNQKLCSQFYSMYEYNSSRGNVARAVSKIEAECATTAGAIAEPSQFTGRCVTGIHSSSIMPVNEGIMKNQLEIEKSIGGGGSGKRAGGHASNLKSVTFMEEEEFVESSRSAEVENKSAAHLKMSQPPHNSL
jgi:hypothetical protein